MCGGEEDLARELAWARSRRGSLYNKDVDAMLAQDADVVANPDMRVRLKELRSKSVFTAALSVWELKNVLKYLDLLGCRDIPFEVGQNAWERLMIVNIVNIGKY